MEPLHELSRSNRALLLLGRSSQALLASADEASLLGEVCRIAVEVGGYRGAWVGLAPPGRGVALVRVAHAGAILSERSSSGLRSDAPSPSAMALATGKPCVARQGDQALSKLPAEALALGCRAAVALPLSVERETAGVLKIYSAEIDAFDDGEVDILQELARDVEIGLTTLRTREQRDRMLAELKASHRQLRTLIESLPDSVARFDTAARLTFVSRPRQSPLQVDPRNAVGRTPVELQLCEDPASDEALVASIQRVFATGRPESVEVRFRTPLGPRPFEVRHFPEWHEDKIISVMGLARDLLAQHLAARDLYLMNFALNCIDEGIYLMRADSPSFEYVNEGAARALGYAREELTSGMTVLDIDPSIDPAGWARLLAEVKRTRRMRIESSQRSRDGETRPVEVTANLFEFEGETYNLAIVRDMSERKRAEAAQQALEAQLRQAQKMEALGQLASGIAHDFNNVLGVVQMGASLLLERGDLDAELREGLEEILGAAGRATGLTRQLLTMSRKQPAELVDLDLGKSVRQTVALLRRVLGEQVALELHAPENRAFIHGDAGMLEQVLMNLAINARDAMPTGGTLAIRVDVTELGELANDRPPGPYVCLSAIDTGCGIAPDSLARIFEPFFTTKAPGHGTGLGLATVFGIVQQHRGFIDVSSVVGSGTTFRVYIPASGGSARPRASSTTPSEPR